MTQAADPMGPGFSLDGLARLWAGILDVAGKAAIAAALVLAAGIVTVAAALAAIVIACGALFWRITGRRAPRRARPGDFDGVTLDARPTGRGWTVE